MGILKNVAIVNKAAIGSRLYFYKWTFIKFPSSYYKYLTENKLIKYHTFVACFESTVVES